MKCIFILLLIPFTLQSQLIITEVQPAPISPEPEWIEIYNISDEAVNLFEYEIGDERVLKSLPEVILKPKRYAVVTKDSLELTSKYLIDENAEVIEIALPALNNTGDAARLYRNGELQDSAWYESGIDKGKSIEKRDYSLGWAESNWSQPVDISGTPGTINSNYPKLYDIRVDSLYQMGSNWIVELSNEGRNDVLIIGLFLDEVKFPIDIVIPAASKWEESLELPESKVFGMRRYELRLTYAMGGVDTLAVLDSLELYFPPDETPIITEIMFDPKDELCDFIEIYYSGSKDLNIEGLILKDDRGNEEIIQAQRIVREGEYLALGKDSTIYSYPMVGNAVVANNLLELTKTGKTLELTLPIDSENSSDSFTYSESMHDSRYGDTKGISLELVYGDDGMSIRSSTDEHGCSPGRQNSWEISHNSEIGISAEPNPFDYNRPTTISYSLYDGSGYMMGAIYNENMQEVRRIHPARPARGMGEIEWDGHDEQGNRLPAGIYIVIFEGLQDGESKKIIERELLIIGE